jgi:hypothetical protein
MLLVLTKGIESEPNANIFEFVGADRVEGLGNCMRHIRPRNGRGERWMLLSHCHGGKQLFYAAGHSIEWTGMITASPIHGEATRNFTRMLPCRALGVGGVSRHTGR